MDKKILVLIGLILMSSMVFANNTNSITSFATHYDSTFNQLVVNASCKAMTIGTVVIDGVTSRDIICSTIGLDATISLPNEAKDLSSFNVTFTIQAPCEKCVAKSKVNVDSDTTNTIFFLFSINNILLYGAIIIIFVFGAWIVRKFTKNA